MSQISGNLLYFYSAHTWIGQCFNLGINMNLYLINFFTILSWTVPFCSVLRYWHCDFSCSLLDMHIKKFSTFGLCCCFWLVFRSVWSESWPQHQLPRLRSVVFLSQSRPIPAQYLEIGLSSFHPHSFQFVVRCHWAIQCRVAWVTDTTFKKTMDK